MVEIEAESIFVQLARECREVLINLAERIAYDGARLKERALSQSASESDAEDEDVFVAEALQASATAFRRSSDQLESWATRHLSLLLLLRGRRIQLRPNNWPKWGEEASWASDVAFTDGVASLRDGVRADVRSALRDDRSNRLSPPRPYLMRESPFRPEQALAGLLYYEAGLRQVDIAELFQISQPAVADMLARVDAFLATGVLARRLEHVAEMEGWQVLQRMIAPERLWGEMRLTKDLSEVEVELETIRSEEELTDRIRRMQLEGRLGSHMAVQRRKKLERAVGITALYDMSNKASYLLADDEIEELSPQKPLSRLTNDQRRFSLDDVISRVGSPRR